MSNDKTTAAIRPAVDIDSIALSAARKIAVIDPTGLPGGAVQALAAIQSAVRDALEVYGTPLEQDLMRRSLADVVDPNEWAAAFCKFVPGAVLGKVDQGVLASWFGDAIMKGFDIASQRSVKRLTMIYECERIIGDPKATDQMKRSASLTKDALLDRQDHGLALVDRRELDEAKTKLDRAVRALQRAGFQDLGGEEWKPPVNEVAGKLQRRVYELEQDLANARQAHEATAGTALMWRDKATSAVGKVLNMRILMARLSYQLNKAMPGNEFSAKATAYLKKHNLIGSPLRTADDETPQEIAEIELTPEQRAELSTASANLEGVDIDAAHKMVEDSNGVLVPEASLMTAHLKTAGLICETMGWPESVYQIPDDGQASTVGNSVDSVDNAPKGEQAQEDQKDQSQDEGKAEEQKMQEKQERKGVFIPGAKWPVPGERRFTLDRRDPMNPANRADPIERSAKDRRKTGKRDS